MKKIIALSVLAATIASTSAFGQGYFILNSGKSQAYDGFTTPGVSAPASTMNVAFLWAAASTTPTVSTLLASTPTTGNSTTLESYTVAQAWADILNGQFTFAVNSSTASLVTATTTSTGVVSYNGGQSFGVVGTSPTTAYTVYEIAWSSAYATPALAAAANGGLGSAVGWSPALQYTAATATDQTQTAMGFSKYGVFIPATVPEPGTLALAALGGAAMLFIRRKK
jgi:hypothetical protein